MTVLIPRQITESVKNTFQNFPCIFINGPSQSGKKTLAQLVLGIKVKASDQVSLKD